MRYFVDQDEFNQVLKKVFVRGVITNYTGMPKALYAPDRGYIILEKNLIIVEAHEDRYNLFYYLNGDKIDKGFISELKALDKPISIEVPFSEGGSLEVNKRSQGLIDYLETEGYSMTIHRRRMKANCEIGHTSNGSTVHSNQIRVVSTEESTVIIKEMTLLFHPIFGYLPTDEELKQDIQNQTVLGIYEHERLCGVLHFQHKNSKYYLLHLMVFEGDRGKGYGRALLEAWFQRVKTIQLEQVVKKDSISFELWVDHMNRPAIDIYEQMGFEFGEWHIKCYLHN